MHLCPVIFYLSETTFSGKSRNIKTRHSVLSISSSSFYSFWVDPVLFSSEASFSFKEQNLNNNNNKNSAFLLLFLHVFYKPIHLEQNPHLLCQQTPIISFDARPVQWGNKQLLWFPHLPPWHHINQMDSKSIAPAIDLPGPGAQDIGNAGSTWKKSRSRC